MGFSLNVLVILGFIPGLRWATTGHLLIGTSIYNYIDRIGCKLFEWAETTVQIMFYTCAFVNLTLVCIPIYRYEDGGQCIP